MTHGRQSIFFVNNPIDFKLRVIFTKFDFSIYSMKIKTIYIFSAILIAVSSFSVSADTLEDIVFFEGRGNYYCYPWREKNPASQTAAPVGIIPFVLEHFGIHGSRLLIGDRFYNFLFSIN